MLKLQNITKDYLLKDQDPVKALKGISLNFRKNEFVAILGHSGCGKTTLLNIIGGLDKYTNGDLIIEGKSTKEFKDGDWDTYRNHSIGFVFQSYNLIPHQNIVSNVELALTIAGISKKERRARASEALKMVGLGGLDRKKPNQLSGGQMQRVAIARALVNNPEIVLADEPTGALDSETSVQIMDLLRDVAKDRLVIMVTHNPDLANEYANRIVRISDGLVIDDSNPFEGIEYSNKKEPLKEESNKSKKEKKKSSMSFFTATGLSFANLLSKLRRTILVVIAGSIGIIGVTSVLSVSNGISHFIDSMQNDMLSSYPIEIAEESVDYTSLMSGMDNFDDKKIKEFDIRTQVGLDSMINYLMTAYSDFTSVKTNVINQELVSYINGLSEDDVAVTQYNYGIDVTNNIFTPWTKDYDNNNTDIISLNGLTQRYIAELKTVNGFSEYASYVDLFTNFMNEIPNNKDYILDQYELVSGSYAEDENEIMLVVTSDTTLTDLVFAQMGFYDHDEFLNIAKKAIKQQEELEKINGETEEEYKARLKERNKGYDEQYPYREAFDFDDLLNKKFYYLPHDAIYSYGEIAESNYYEINIVISKEGEMYNFQYDEESDLLTGVHIITSPFDYEIVFASRIGEKPIVSEENKTALMNGAWAGTNMNQDSFFAFNILNASDTSEAIVFANGSSFEEAATSLATPTMESLSYKSKTTGTAKPAATGYNYCATLSQSDIDNLSANGGIEMKISGILRAKEDTNFGCLSRGVYYTKKFADKYINDASNSHIITDPITGFKDYINSGNEKEDSFKAYVTFEYLDYKDENNPVEKNGYASSLNGDLAASFSSLFSNITGVDYHAQDQTFIRALAGLKVIDNTDGIYTFDVLPQSISIYPYNFEAKDNVTDYLDKWNSDEMVTVTVNGVEKTLAKEDRDELTYSDTIEIIITVINTLIKTITIALVVFTSLSLVVSCFMIAVITYISVMERVKEIGVIRSLGGRKKDVSRLFISENFMIGLASGLFGVVMTFFLCMILNICIAKFNVGRIGLLTMPIALIMTTLSIILNVMSGLIPSMRASKQDPVIALRSE